MKIQIPHDVKIILDKLHKNNYKAYIVGGCVRDSILNREINDWDINTNALPGEIMELFSDFNVIETGLQHGTLTIILNNNKYEITTFRADGDYGDGRHPNNVEFISELADDLLRRDFTMNAIAYNEQEGIVDPFNGLEDIANGIIRCVGNPRHRFNEDGLRILRAIRFHSRLGFEIEYNTLTAMKQRRHKLKNISKERIRDEISKILIGEHVYSAILTMTKSKLFYHTIPEIIKCIDFKQYNKHHDKDVFNHIIHVVKHSPSKLEIRLAALFHDIGKPECFTLDEDNCGHFYKHHISSSKITKNIMSRLRFDNKTIDKVSILVREHMSRYDHLRTTNIKKFITRVGIENLDDLFELQIADIKSSAPEYHNIYMVTKLRDECYKILSEKQPLSRGDLEVNGKDLINIGFKPGKELGNVIDILLEKVLEDPTLNDKEALINIAKEISLL